MKNLFKKMMLVAVAAMAFVACSQDNDEINATVKKTDVVFNLSIEDVTRAYFGEEKGSGSDTSFPSYWSGGESVTLVAYDSSDVVLATAWGSIEAEGEQATQARVGATFEGDLAGVAKVRAYVGSWSYGEPRVPEVGQEQYMEKEGTVASNAHTMSAEAAWDGVAQSIDLNFSHAVAYGRMQIKDLDVTITKAIVKVDEAEYQVSLNSELDTKYIWFACDANDAIATLDIEVKASNGRSYVKTIDMTAVANPLKFRTGEVSKFAVSGLTEKPADYTLDLNKVVARTGNTITFQGDEEDDKWTVIFNEGLTEIAEGVYQGVYGAAWTNESALEYDYFNSSFNLAVNPAQYGYYGDDSTINVSVEDGIYTITAFWTSYIGGPDKTVQISYVGDLTVETPVVPEPEELVFTSAEWANTSLNDKFVKFYTADGAVLQLNWWKCGEDKWIEPRTYGFNSGGYDIYPGSEYSYYDEVPDVDLEGSLEVADGTVVVSIVDGQYYIEFTDLVDWDGNMVIESATFKGLIDGLELPDTRTQLAAPTVNATADGKVINISWNEIVGADQYYIFCYVGGLEAITTNETSVSIEAAYGTNYEFLIRAEALDSNPDYKTSEDTYFSVKTANDPNSFAQYMATDLKWDPSGYFVFTVSQYEIFRVKMNDADCPNHTTIKAGDYTGVASSSVSPGQFSVYQKIVGGYSEGWTSTKTASTMSVSYVDGEYVIIVNYDGAYGGDGEVGYKGVPTGWDIPGASGGDSGEGEGGDSGEGDGEGDGGNTGNELGSENNPYTFASVSSPSPTSFLLNFEGAENGASLRLDRQNTSLSPMVGYEGAFALNYTAIIYGGSGNIYTVGGTTYSYAQFAPYSTMEVTQSGDTYTFNVKISVDGSTYTYYTYTGAVN